MQCPGFGTPRARQGQRNMNLCYKSQGDALLPEKTFFLFLRKCEDWFRNYGLLPKTQQAQLQVQGPASPHHPCSRWTYIGEWGRRSMLVFRLPSFQGIHRVTHHQSQTFMLRLKLPLSFRQKLDTPLTLAVFTGHAEKGAPAGISLLQAMFCRDHRGASKWHRI